MNQKESSQPNPLTPKEKMVLEFLETYFLDNGFAPTFTEIKDHFGFASFNSVQRYLKQLQKKNYIELPGGNQKRALSILHPSHSLQSSFQNKFESSSPKVVPIVTEIESSDTANTAGSLSLPLLGRVAAGRPLEAVEHNEFVDLPVSLIPHPNKSYALIVEGDSMIEDGIFDGDTIFVQKQEQANNGEIVIAMIENEATVKRIYFHNNKSDIELRPSNSTMESMWYPPTKVKIEGILVGLIRKF